MTVTKITNSTVYSLPSNPDERYKIWDQRLARFGIAVEKSGRHKWIVRYGKGKDVRDHVIGPVITMSVEDAREEAGKIQKNGGPLGNGDSTQGDPTMKDIIDHYSTTLETTQSKELLSFATRHIYPHLKADMHVRTITVIDVQDMYDALKKLGRRKVHKNAVAYFKAAFNAAIRQFNMDDRGRIAIGNPATGIELPKGPKRRRSLTLTQYKALGAAMEDMWTNQFMDGMYAAGAIWCLTFMGGRKNEILRARREDVDPDYQFLTVKDHKTVDTIGPKHIPIPAPAAAVLKQLPVKPGWEAWFFPGRKFDKPLVNIRKRYVKLKDAANKILAAQGHPLISMEVRGFTIHDLRKAFANTGLRMAKLMMEEVQAQLHHTDINTTRTYIDEDPNYTKQAHDKTAAVISQAMGQITFDPTKNNMPAKTRRKLVFQEPIDQKVLPPEPTGDKKAA